MHKKVDIADTAMLEYLEIFKMEYEREFNKKQSFDNRAGLILTLLGAISIFLFEHIKINEIITLIKFPISFLNIIKAFSGLTVYVAFIYTVIKSIANQHRSPLFHYRCHIGCTKYHIPYGTRRQGWGRGLLYGWI